MKNVMIVIAVALLGLSAGYAHTGTGVVNMLDAPDPLVADDDSATVQAANRERLQFQIDQNVVIYIPAGEYWFDGTLDFSQATTISLIGESAGMTKLRFSGVDSAKKAAIYYKEDSMNHSNARPIFENIAIKCDFDGLSEGASGVLLEQTVNSTSNSSPRLTSVRVLRGDATEAFDIGFNIRGFGQPEFHDCTFQGVEPDQSGGSAPHSFAGFVFDDNSDNTIATINPQLYASSVYSAEYAVYVTGENEGGKIIGCNFQEVNWGLLIDHEQNGSAINSQPYFTMSDSHVNANRGAIYIQNARMIHIHNNHFYQKVTSNAATFYHIRILGPVVDFDEPGSGEAPKINFMHQIIGNYMHSANHAGFAYGIWANNTSYVNAIGNQFVSLNKPIFLAANTWYCDVSLGNKGYIHPQETDSGKLSYVSADFVTDNGNSNTY